jgi:ATP-dependent Clp protease ATP-binding subunit ClpA
MFERFTHAARDVVVRAQHEAREMDQRPIGTQHTLIALLADADGPIARALREDGVDAAYVRAEVLRRVGAGPAAAPELRTTADADDAAALKAIGIDLDAVRRAIEENFGPGSLQLPRTTVRKRKGLFGRVTDHLPFSPRNKKVLELSLREAIRLDHNYIAPEHILLGMLREGDGLGVQILAEKGVDLAALREAATRSLHHPAA